MVHQVVFHKSGNKVVTMIVAVVPTQLEIDRFLGAGGFDRGRDVVVQEANLAVGPGARFLDHGEGADEVRKIADFNSGDGKVLDGAQGLNAVIGLAGDGSLAQEVVFHALGATLFYGFLIYWAEVSISNKPVRRIVQGSLAFVIVLMGYSRVELGAHWPTDVLGGYAIGLLVLGAMIWLHRRWTGENQKERPAQRAL